MTDAGDIARALDRLEWLFGEVHVGPDNAITAAEVSELIPTDGDSHATKPETREHIRTLIDERAVPVVSGSNGYYRATCREQVEEYVDSQHSRAQAIVQRGEIVDEAWAEAGPPTAAETPDDPMGLTPEERERVEADPVLTVDDVRQHGGEQA